MVGWSPGETDAATSATNQEEYYRFTYSAVTFPTSSAPNKETELLEELM